MNSYNPKIRDLKMYENYEKMDFWDEEIILKVE